MRRTRGPLAATIVAGAIVMVAPALAQEDDLPETSLTADVTVTPSKAGTDRAPRGVTFRAAATIETEPGFDPPIITGVDILTSDGFVYHHEDYAQCSKRTLDREGPAGCPRKSIMGSAVASPGRTP